MQPTPTIIFVCEHGAAKSIIAAAHFNKLTEERNLETRAIARGTHPDSELSSKTIASLQADGLTPTESTPQKLSLPDIESAQQIITFCELPEVYQHKVNIEKWTDVPPVSENYEIARDAIIKHIKDFLNK
jgi:arsenate reductase